MNEPAGGPQVLPAMGHPVGHFLPEDAVTPVVPSRRGCKHEPHKGKGGGQVSRKLGGGDEGLVRVCMCKIPR